MGWRVSSSPKTDFVLDALEQALDDCRPVHKGGLSHHSDRGGPYLSIRYIERLADAAIDPSMDSIGSPYYNALAETLNGLYKAEIIHWLGPWENSGRCRTGNPQIGRLVQQPSPACTHRIHPAIRG